MKKYHPILSLSIAFLVLCLSACSGEPGTGSSPTKEAESRIPIIFDTDANN